MSDSCDPMDCRPPGFSVHGISQSRILKWGIFQTQGSNSCLLHCRSILLCLSYKGILSMPITELLIIVNMHFIAGSLYLFISITHLSSNTATDPWKPLFYSLQSEPLILSYLFQRNIVTEIFWIKTGKKSFTHGFLIFTILTIDFFSGVRLEKDKDRERGINKEGKDENAKEGGKLGRCF